MTDEIRYAEIAVLNGSPQRGAFTYAVPADLEIRRGMSVVVPWRTQWALGIVLEVTSESEVTNPRPIINVLDASVLLSQQQLELASWIADKYLAPISACVSLFLPPGTPTKPRKSASTFRPIMPAAPTVPKRLELSITDQQLWELIDAWPMSKPSRPAQLLLLLSAGNVAIFDAARTLGGTRALNAWLDSTSLATRHGEVVRLAIDPNEARQAADSLRRTAAERRQLVLLRLLASGDVDEAEAKRLSETTQADIAALEHTGVVRRRAVVTAESSASPIPAPRLTADQQDATAAILRSLEAGQGETMLLHGVTGSGKTEVYLAASEQALATGGGVIVLVPEIALAPQTIARFEARFPGQVAVRHSGLSRSEAREQWRQVAAGEKRVLVGARSALFGPIQDLALVIVDEEHEWTYKQSDPQPRYHAGAVARAMAHRWGVVSVLGSATPDIVSMSAARSGQCKLLKLPDRIQSGAGEPIVIPQPIVDVVDMRDELVAGVRSVFSRELDAAISEALVRDEQVLLFLNRRGMSALVCRACGEAVGCRRCDISMTLHRPGPFLQCHECGERQSVPALCPTCGDSRIGAMSFGTAQLEAEVRRRWGEVPITRWDRDTSSSSESHESLLKEFAEGRSQVLIGTQMIAKGLDLPRVTVAGVVNADLSLRESDYMASERTFQLLSQVAGRAGRGALGGRVIVQTYAPDHFAVVAAAAHDYEAFYRQEMSLRATLDYPPYGRLTRLTVARSSAAEAIQEADRVVRELVALRASEPGAVADVIGPAPANPARRLNQWRRQVLLKGENPAVLLSRLDLGRGWSVDVDPVG